MEHLNEKNFNIIPEPEKESVVLEQYDKLFERIEDADILPSFNNENEWSIEELEQTMSQVFFEYGKTALDTNTGKIYTTLSGGLDSTLALALLRKEFPSAEIITFSMGGTENHPDITHARLAAKKFDTKHHEFIPTSDEILESLTEYRSKLPKINLENACKTGDTDVYLLYKYISKFNPQLLLAHDGIDELMGGYWNHRKDMSQTEREMNYKYFWNRLIPDNLMPLTATANNFGIDLLFPYLDERIVKTISNIPLLNRSSIEVSKEPLRTIAQTLGVPKEILTRSKRGQVGMLDLE